MRICFEYTWDKNGVDLPNGVKLDGDREAQLKHAHQRTMAMPPDAPHRFRQLEAILSIIFFGMLGYAGSFQSTVPAYNPETDKWIMRSWTTNDGDPTVTF
jgi:hypothetical protein